MTDECAKQFDWKGKGDKKAFSTLRFPKVVFCKFLNSSVEIFTGTDVRTVLDSNLINSLKTLPKDLNLAPKMYKLI